MARVNSGTMTVVIFSILIGLGGAFVVRQQISRPVPTHVAELAPTPQNIVVPVAAIDLEPGQTLSINEIALKSYTPEKYSDSEYAGQAYVRQTEHINGRMLKTPVKKGQAFLPDFFYPGGGGPGIAERLQAGYRAVTVPIENVGAVHGFARPGSVVDVLFRSNPEGERPEVTLTLLERVEVLALDTQVAPSQQVELKGAGTVTLAVTPHQAKVLKVVEGRGELTLTLRNPGDDVDVVPFELGQADPFLGRLDPSGDFIPVGLTTPAAVASTSSSSSAAGKVDIGAIGSVSTVVDASAERVTLDDLLGLQAKAGVKQMEIYLGAQKNVVEFPQPQGAAIQVLQRGGRIRTPIAHEPDPRGLRRLGAGPSPRTTSTTTKSATAAGGG